MPSALLPWAEGCSLMAVPAVLRLPKSIVRSDFRCVLVTLLTVWQS